MKTGVETYIVVEGDRDISSFATLLGAASEWGDRPGVRRVYRAAPTGPYGPNAWEKVAEVSATALRAALDEAKRLRGSGEPRPFGS
ncbi:MAG: hypothetical protein WA324_00550 [Bryobacteraceae bacterium]